MINIIQNTIGALARRGSAAPANLNFEFSVKTDNAGTSANNQFTIPTTGSGYNYNISTSEHALTGQTGDVTLTFATAGTYDIVISGDFPRIYFANSGNESKLVDIKSWGSQVWTSSQKAFKGCNNLIPTFTDAPDLSIVTSTESMFYGCTNFNQDISSWDVSNVQQMNTMFRLASNFNQDISSWDVGNVSNMYGVFISCTSFDQDISSWDVRNVTSLSNFMAFSGLSTSNYDALLIGWEAQAPNTGLTPNFGSSKYTAGGAAAAARASLISTYGWTITDGGIA